MRRVRLGDRDPGLDGYARVAFAARFAVGQVLAGIVDHDDLALHVGGNDAVFDRTQRSVGAVVVDRLRVLGDEIGKDVLVADPKIATAVIRSAQLMLRHLGEHHAADKIHDGLEKVYRTKDKLTRDVGGKAGTSEFADAIIQFMETSTDVPAQAESSHA